MRFIYFYLLFLFLPFFLLHLLLLFSFFFAFLSKSFVLHLHFFFFFTSISSTDKISSCFFMDTFFFFSYCYIVSTILTTLIFLKTYNCYYKNDRITGPLSNKSQSHREIHRGRSERREVSFVEPSQRTRSLTREENYSREDPVERSLSSQRLSSGRSSRSDSRVTFALDVVDHSQEMQKKNDQAKVCDEKIIH